MNRLLQILSGKTISIVGNHKCNIDYSNEIDSAEIVIRFDDFYNYNFKFVGEKVNIIFQTVEEDFQRHENKFIDVIQKQSPNIFIVNDFDIYASKFLSDIGDKIRIDIIKNIKYDDCTTSAFVLNYLAQNLKNAKVKCYAFAKKEHNSILDSINKLESLEITSPATEIPNTIVIPIKKNSLGAPNKNRILIRKCIDKCLRCTLPIYLIGDDEELFDELKTEYNEKINTCFISGIKPYDDVTITIRKWASKTNYCGNIVLVQCTSPNLKTEWINECVDKLRFAPLTATSCQCTFKPTALYKEQYGVYIPYSKYAPSASVARQLLPKAIRINGAVEAFHSDQLKYDSFYDNVILKPIIVPEEDSLDIDTQEQLDTVLAKQ